MFMSSKFIGTLVSAKSDDGTDYTDWRSELIGKTGLAMAFESEKLYPGKCFLLFVSEDGTGADQEYLAVDPEYYLRTTYGTMSDDGRYSEMRTKNSIYRFQNGIPEGKEIDWEFLESMPFLTGKLSFGWREGHGRNKTDIAGSKPKYTDKIITGDEP